MTPQQREQFTRQLAELTPERPTVTYEMEGHGLRRPPCDRDVDRPGAVRSTTAGSSSTSRSGATSPPRNRPSRRCARARSVTAPWSRTRPRSSAASTPIFRLTFANEAHCRLLAGRSEELLGQDFFASVPLPVSGDGFAPPDAGSDARQSRRHRREREGPAGRQVRWFSWTNRALFDDEGRVTGYQSVGRDITEQKQAEGALRESEAAMRAVAEGVPCRWRSPIWTSPNPVHQCALPSRPSAWRSASRPDRIAQLLGRSRRPDAAHGLWTAEGQRRRLRGSHAAGRRQHRLGAVLGAHDDCSAGEPAYRRRHRPTSPSAGAMEEALRPARPGSPAFMENAPVGMYLKDHGRPLRDGQSGDGQGVRLPGREDR